MGDRTIVIGVGNADRGDDGVGPAVVERLFGPLPPGTDIVASDGDPGDIIDAMDGHDRLILVDAIAPDHHPGRVVRLTDLGDLGTVRAASSHMLGPAEVLGLARVLGRLPSTVVVYGVEGAAFDAGAPLTDAVGLGVDVAVGMILEELDA